MPSQLTPVHALISSAIHFHRVLFQQSEGGQEIGRCINSYRKLRPTTSSPSGTLEGWGGDHGPAVIPAQVPSP